MLICAYTICYLFLWSNFNFLHNSQWITLPTQLCVVLYTYWANLQHSLIMWLIVLSLSSHNQHLLFCWVLYCLALISLVLIALFCAAIWRDSVSLLKFPFLSHIQIFSCEMLLINFFFCIDLFDGISFQDTQVFVRFLCSESTNFVLIWQSHSFCQVSFATFHY